MNRSLTGPLTRSFALGLFLTPAALAQNIEVIYSKIYSSSTSDTPWTLDLAGALTLLIQTKSITRIEVPA